MRNFNSCVELFEFISYDNTIMSQELINILLYSDKEDSRRAKIELDRLELFLDNKESLYNLFLKNAKDLKELDNYQGITSFIYAAKWHIFFCKEADFDTWANLLLFHIQSPSGIVRNAVVKIFPKLLCSIKFSKNYLKSPSAKDLELIKKYGELSERVEDLLIQYDDAKFDKFKYVIDLPVSVYKSLNYLWVDLNYYMNGEKLIDYYWNNIKTSEILSFDIMENRKLTVLVDFDNFLKLNNIKLRVEDIIDIIYQENTYESLKIAMSYICSQVQISAQIMPSLLEHLNLLWQVFPHFDLDGKAPIELINKK